MGGDPFRPSRPGAFAAGDAEQHAAILDEVELAVWIFDIDHQRVHWANRAALAVWNAPTLDELRSRDMASDMSATVARRLAQYQQDFIARDARFSEQWTLYPGGKPCSLAVSFSGHRLVDGRMAMLCQGRPIQSAEPESVRSVEALLHTAVRITLYGADGQALYRNPAARESASSSTETLQQHIVDAAACQRLNHLLAADGQAALTLQVRTVDGVRWHELLARRCLDAVTGVAAVLVSEVDVSPLKDSEARAQYLAGHDALTGLPNRTQVRQRFAEAVTSLSSSGLQAALILIDLDHFKRINDSLGHAAGDELLIEIARRLRESIRRTDLAARFGGDEFLILVMSDDAHAEVARIHHRIKEAISKPMQIGGTTVRATATMGVSLFPGDGEDFTTLLRQADLAMYTAKDAGRNALAYYAASMGRALNERTAIEQDLRRALERDEFEMHYQPRIDTTSGRVLGAEALVRWRHPLRGLVMPDGFIPVCEEMGLIRDLGRWVFKAVVEQAASWQRRGLDLSISINLSPREFSDPELAGDMGRALALAGCDARGIQMEITESMLLGAEQHPLATLRAIEALGLSIALDDFGTGYSNLAYLQRFPITTLKIDRTFIQSIESDRPLAELIVNLCHLMHLTAVAEGVETQEQLEWVARQGIQQYQGFLFSKAVPAGEFEALLRRLQGEAATGDAPPAPGRADAPARSPQA